jgi:hypothetical protein
MPDLFSSPKSTGVREYRGQSTGVRVKLNIASKYNQAQARTLKNLSSTLLRKKWFAAAEYLPPKPSAMPPALLTGHEPGME